MRWIVGGLVLATLAAGTLGPAWAEQGPIEEPRPRQPVPGVREGLPPPEGRGPSHGAGPPGEWSRGRTGPRPGIFGPVTDEEVAQILEFLGQYLPEIRVDLEKMRDENPSLFQAYMRRMRFEIRQLKSLRQEDEKAFQNALEEKRLRHRARDLAARIRAGTNDADRERLRTELREVVGKLFDVELITREAHLKRLEEQLKRLREELKESGTRRAQEIEQRLERFINPPPARPPEEGGPPAEGGPRPPERGGPPPAPPPPGNAGT